MKPLLTSSGIGNATLLDALVRLLGKPVAESTALVVPTAILPHVLADAGQRVQVQHGTVRAADALRSGVATRCT